MSFNSTGLFATEAKPSAALDVMMAAEKDADSTSALGPEVGANSTAQATRPQSPEKPAASTAAPAPTPAPAPAPAPATIDPLHTSSPELLGQPVTLEAFRALVGIPQQEIDPSDNSAAAAAMRARMPPPPTVSRRTWRNYFFWRDAASSERSTSMYYKLRHEERRARVLHKLVDVVVYGSMVAQMVFAAALIVLGALNGDYHVPVAVIGAMTGVLTGILSLLKGQGLPNRFIRYAAECRRVADEIEFMERGLRSDLGRVTYGNVLALHRMYEETVNDAVQNHPNAWVSSLPTPGAPPAAAAGKLGAAASMVGSVGALDGRQSIGGGGGQEFAATRPDTNGKAKGS